VAETSLDLVSDEDYSWRSRISPAGMKPSGGTIEPPSLNRLDDDCRRLCHSGVGSEYVIKVSGTLRLQFRFLSKRAIAQYGVGHRSAPQAVKGQEVFAGTAAAAQRKSSKLRI
jgi:hypothetical protein